MNPSPTHIPRSAAMRFLPAILWLGLLIFLSSQNGQDTAALSARLGTLLRTLPLPGQMTEVILLHSRTAAHVLVFLMEAMLLMPGMNGVLGSRGRSALWTMGFCTALAFLDEGHKVLIPGRHCTWSEAWLNVLGAGLGIAIYLLFRRSKEGLQARKRRH